MGVIITGVNKLEAFGYIAAQAVRGEITFPTSVNAVLRLQLALDDPDCHIDEAIRLVLAEPQLAARTVAIANTPAFGGSSATPVTNVRAAVARIGYRRLQALVASLVVRQFGNRINDPGLRAKAEQLWAHTTHVASIAHSLARRITGIDPDTALFAGIVHEVGGFYLLSRAESLPGLLDDNLDAWLDHGEAAIGRGVLHKLGVPGPVMSAIEALWDGMRALPPETLGDTLLLANDLATHPSPLFNTPGATTHAAAATIDFVFGDGTLKGVLEESDHEVKSLTAALL